MSYYIFKFENIISKDRVKIKLESNGWKFFKKETKNLILYQVGYIFNLRIIISIREFKVFCI